MRGIIDRFEGEYAVVEIEGQMKNVSLGCIPGEAREGDVLVFENNAWQVDRSATLDLKKQTEAQMKRLWQD
jgi:hypothetical protein